VPPARGPGPVAVVHRITIATALAGALAYATWAASQRNWLATAAGVAAAIAIGAYLRNLRARLDRKLGGDASDPS
jgi:ABC-type nitrate/sulfonate/bicarbonate transport system permease component